MCIRVRVRIRVWACGWRACVCTRVWWVCARGRCACQVCVRVRWGQVCGGQCGQGLTRSPGVCGREQGVQKGGGGEKVTPRDPITAVVLLLTAPAQPG